MKTRRPLLPDDYDSRCLLGAPADQQVPGYLRGGELMELANLCRQGVVKLELPRFRLRCRTFFGRRSIEHPVHLVRVLVEPDLQRVSVVWKSTLSVGPEEVERLDKSVVDLGVPG